MFLSYALGMPIIILSFIMAIVVVAEHGKSKEDELLGFIPREPSVFWLAYLIVALMAVLGMTILIQ